MSTGNSRPSLTITGTSPRRRATGATSSGQSIQFTDDKSQLSGSVTVGQFEEDDSYTRIDVQVTAPTSGASGG